MTADARSTAPSAYRSVNPATGRVLAEHPTATDAQVQEALASSSTRSANSVPTRAATAARSSIGRVRQARNAASAPARASCTWHRWRSGARPGPGRSPG